MVGIFLKRVIVKSTEKKISPVNAETQTVEKCKTDELFDNTEENYEDYIDRGIPTTWHIRVYNK